MKMKRAVLECAGYLVGRPAEKRQRHVAFSRAGTQLLRHVRKAVPKSTSLVNDALRDELALPPLVISSRPSADGRIAEPINARIIHYTSLKMGGENIPPVIQSLFKLIGWLETFKHLKQGKQNALLPV